MAGVVQGIINQEVQKTCIFDPSKFNDYYEFAIDWTSSKTTSKQYKIYRIKHLESKEGFRFAVRGCVL